MTFDDVLRIITSLLAILGAIGGIPQLIRWLRPKPHVKISSRIEDLPEENCHKLHIEVLNEKKWWKRNKDAMHVIAQWYIMDKNKEHWGATYNQAISPYLGVGEKVHKEFKIVHRFNPEGNPHTIVILVKCDPDTQVKETITHSE
jgi:hypothetical protein